MELELKHLAAYLPFELNVILNKNKLHYSFDNEKGKIIGIDFNIILDFDNLDNYVNAGLTWFKLILKPISLLEKDIEILNILAKKLSEAKTSIFSFESSKMWILELLKDENATALPFFLTEILLKNHYDIFGLINEDLAIDINCL